MDREPHLVRWDVPFAASSHPSVSIITEQGGDVVSLLVAPGGIEQYPQFLVRFDKVLALLCCEEALALGRDYPAAAGSDAGGCAYLWPDSPWLRASHGWAVDFLQWREVGHYVVFGADSVVELLASCPPKVERIDGKRIIETKHVV